MRNVVLFGLGWLLLLAGVLRADEVVLTTGETLNGKIIDKNDQAVVLEHPALGNLTIARDKVAATVLDEPAGPLPEATEEPDPALLEEPGAFRRFIDGFLADWDKRFEAGFSGTSGNSESRSMRLSFNAFKETATDRWQIDTAYYFAEDDGQTSRNEFDFFINKDWFHENSKWLYFLRGGYEWDEFQDWQQRVSAYGGLGYTVVKNDRLELVVRGGLGALQELDGEETFRPEGLLSAAAIKYQLTEHQELSGGVTFFPQLDEFGEYRLVANGEWRIKMPDVDGMSLKLGIENEYQTDPGPDSKNNDLKYYGAVVFEF